MDGKAIGARVRQLRKSREPVQSQEQLAHHAGVTRLAINNLELGKTPEPNYTTLQGIADYYSIDVGWLINGDRPESQIDTSDADVGPTDQEEDIEWAADATDTGEPGKRKLRELRRSIGRMSRRTMLDNLETWKANQASEGLAFAKGADRSQAEPPRRDPDAPKARGIKPKANR